MTAREFEERVAAALRKRGWVVIQFFKGLGVDIFAYAPDGTSACIQCHNEMGSVADDAVMLAIEAKKAYNCPMAVIVTRGGYTDVAKSIAYATEVRLMRFIEETGKLEYAQELSWLIPW